MSGREATSGTAVVVGGSIAGMCSARVLAKYFKRVVVLEADAIDARALEGRKGVPQSRYAHALLRGGELALEQLFPGLDAELRARGALRFDMGRHVAFLRAKGWSPAFATGFELYWCSRTLTEAAVRACFLRHEPIELRERARVTELRTQVRNGVPHVTGVVVRREDGTSELLDASLVVDASGRSSQSLRWLEQLGAAKVEEERVDAHVAYAGRWYRAPPRSERPAAWWWDGLWIDPIAGRAPVFAVLIPAEHELWFAGMAVYGPWNAPRDEAEFMQALRSVRTPLLAEAVARAEPLSDVLVTRSTVNHFRHFERGPTRVRGLLAVGDAVCSFNPAHGQGMTVAAQAALVLDQILAKHGPMDARLESRFFSAHAKLCTLPWTLSTGADLQFATTDGRRPPLGHVLSPYFGALLRCAHVTPAVMQRIIPVFHLSADMRELMHPGLIATVARHALEQQLRRTPLTAALDNAGLTLSEQPLPPR